MTKVTLRHVHWHHVERHIHSDWCKQRSNHSLFSWKSHFNSSLLTDGILCSIQFRHKKTSAILRYVWVDYYVAVWQSCLKLFCILCLGLKARDSGKRYKSNYKYRNSCIFSLSFSSFVFSLAVCSMHFISKSTISALTSVTVTFLCSRGRLHTNTPRKRWDSWSQVIF